MINVNYHVIILLKHYFFFKKTCLITQSKLLISVYLRICINDIAICTKVSLFTNLVGMEAFGTSIWRIILFILLKLYDCEAEILHNKILHVFFFFKCSINISIQNISLSS